MVERRKKKRDGDNEGKTAGKKKTRPRKARPNPEETRSPDPDASPSGLSGQGGADTASTSSLKSTASPIEDQGQAPRAPLPGEIYQRADRWWWRVKLPGEDKAKARPLQPEGVAAAATDRETAEKTAFEMWEHAIQENVTRQLRMESAEKIERLKAQFLDKVRHFTELVETANAKIEAEAKARAEAEAKLAQMAQTAEAKTKDRGQRTEDRERPALQSGARACEAPVLPAPSDPAEVSGQVVPRAESKPQPEPPAIAHVVPPDLIPTPPLETGVCECCGATGIATACLTRIDSGQSLCPRCLTALRADVARIDPDVSD